VLAAHFFLYVPFGEASLYYAGAVYLTFAVSWSYLDWKTRNAAIRGHNAFVIFTVGLLVVLLIVQKEHEPFPRWRLRLADYRGSLRATQSPAIAASGISCAGGGENFRMTLHRLRPDNRSRQRQVAYSSPPSPLTSHPSWHLSPEAFLYFIMRALFIHTHCPWHLFAGETPYMYASRVGSTQRKHDHYDACISRHVCAKPSLMTPDTVHQQVDAKDNEYV